MTANPHSIDLSAFVAEHLEHAEPDVLRSMLSSFIQALMSAEADAVCGAGYGVRSAERTNSRNGYRSRDFDTRAGTMEVAIPKLREGSYFPEWLLERRRRAETGPGQRGGDQLSARGLHAPDGEAGRAAGHHPAVEVAGQRDGQGARRAGRRLPEPAARPRALHLRRRGRVDHEGPRGRPGSEGACAHRSRGQRRRTPRDPRPGRHLRRGRRRLAGVLPRSECPRPVRGRPGDLRRPPGSGRGDRRHPARRLLAAVPHPLRGEPDGHLPESRLGLGQSIAALGL